MAMVQFQSAPPAEARGDLIFQLGMWRRRIEVSIRSPRRSEGRSSDLRPPARQPLFQSAPPAEARGDSAGPLEPCEHVRFNPLPPPKRGEIIPVHAVRPLRLVSIRSPRRSEGRFGLL